MKPWLNNTLLLLSQYYHNNSVINNSPKGSLEACTGTVYIHTLYSIQYVFLICPEPEFINVWGAQESIPPAYAWRTGTMMTLYVVPAGQAT